MIANSAVDSKGMFEGEISNRDQHDMKANDNQSSDGEIGDESPFDTIEYLAAV